MKCTALGKVLVACTRRVISYYLNRSLLAPFAEPPLSDGSITFDLNSQEDIWGDVKSFLQGNGPLVRYVDPSQSRVLLSYLTRLYAFSYSDSSLCPSQQEGLAHTQVDVSGSTQEPSHKSMSVSNTDSVTPGSSIFE